MLCVQGNQLTLPGYSEAQAFAFPVADFHVSGEWFFAHICLSKSRASMLMGAPIYYVPTVSPLSESGVGGELELLFTETVCRELDVLTPDEFDTLRGQRAFLSNFLGKTLSGFRLLSLMFDVSLNGLAVTPGGRDVRK